MQIAPIGRALVTALAGLALAACVSSRGPREPAELVLRNARIYTVDPRRPWADALAVRDGRFVRVGDARDVAELVGPQTRVFDLAGRFVLPGFHDAHVHALDAGLELDDLSLANARSGQEIRALVLQRAAERPDEEWIVGTGWDQSLFPGGEPPRDLVGELGAARPVLLYAADGAHSAWASARALELAGLDRDSLDPPNGRIERDLESGEPTGLLRESAVGLVARLAPVPSADERTAALRRALAELARVGIVAFQEASAGPESVATFRALEAAGELHARVRLALLLPDGLGADEQRARIAWIRATRAALDGPRLSAGTVKLFLDGVIEGRTAALLEPYLDERGRPDARFGVGLARFEQGELERVVAELDGEGFQLHFHAIGDRAVRMALDAIEAARATNGPSDVRHHLAHVQLVDPADLARFGELGAAANVQALWAYADGYITELTEPVLGATRSRWIYPIRSFIESGATVVGGSDWPVTSPNPLEAIQIAVTRKPPGDAGAPAWNPAEQASLASMIEAYTLAGAWLEGNEQRAGSIEPGKLADFVVLDRDLFAIPPEEIARARVLWTVLEGREIFRAEEW